MGDVKGWLCFGSGVIALYRKRLLDRSRSAHDGTFQIQTNHNRPLVNCPTRTAVPLTKLLFFDAQREPAAPPYFYA